MKESFSTRSTHWSYVSKKFKKHVIFDKLYCVMKSNEKLPNRLRKGYKCVKTRLKRLCVIFEEFRGLKTPIGFLPLYSLPRARKGKSIGGRFLRELYDVCFFTDLTHRFDIF